VSKRTVAWRHFMPVALLAPTAFGLEPAKVVQIYGRLFSAVASTDKSPMPRLLEGTLFFDGQVAKSLAHLDYERLSHTVTTSIPEQ
jgi:hypothetical protein